MIILYSAWVDIIGENIVNVIFAFRKCIWLKGRGGDNFKVKQNIFGLTDKKKLIFHIFLSQKKDLAGWKIPIISTPHRCPPPYRQPSSTGTMTNSAN